jgi:hypothetical protein
MGPISRTCGGYFYKFPYDGGFFVFDVVFLCICGGYKMVKVAFYKANQPHADWKDKLIALYTKGKYSHVELIISDIMYSTSPRDGEVRAKKHKFDENVWDYIEIDNIEISKVIEFFKMTKDQKYDWMGILGFIIPFKDRTNCWFCSEWVSNALKISGCKKLWKQEPSKISPNKLYKILKGN